MSSAPEIQALAAQLQLLEIACRFNCDPPSQPRLEAAAAQMRDRLAQERSRQQHLERDWEQQRQAEQAKARLRQISLEGYQKIQAILQSGEWSELAEAVSTLPNEPELGKLQKQLEKYFERVEVLGSAYRMEQLDLALRHIDNAGSSERRKRIAAVQQRIMLRQGNWSEERQAAEQKQDYTPFLSWLVEYWRGQSLQDVKKDAIPANAMLAQIRWLKAEGEKAAGEVGAEFVIGSEIYRTWQQQIATWEKDTQAQIAAEAQAAEALSIIDTLQKIGLKLVQFKNLDSIESSELNDCPQKLSKLDVGTKAVQKAYAELDKKQKMLRLWQEPEVKQKILAIKKGLLELKNKLAAAKNHSLKNALQTANWTPDQLYEKVTALRQTYLELSQRLCNNDTLAWLSSEERYHLLNQLHLLNNQISVWESELLQKETMQAIIQTPRKNQLPWEKPDGSTPQNIAPIYRMLSRPVQLFGRPIAAGWLVLAGMVMLIVFILLSLNLAGTFEPPINIATPTISQPLFSETPTPTYLPPVETSPGIGNTPPLTNTNPSPELPAVISETHSSPYPEAPAPASP